MTAEPVSVASEEDGAGGKMPLLDHLIELGGRVEVIVLSHSHPDHVCAAEELRRGYQAPILAHAATAAQLTFKIDRHLHDDEVLTSGNDPQWRLRCSAASCGSSRTRDADHGRQ